MLSSAVRVALLSYTTLLWSVAPADALNLPLETSATAVESSAAQSDAPPSSPVRSRKGPSPAKVAKGVDLDWLAAAPKRLAPPVKATGDILAVDRETGGFRPLGNQLSVGADVWMLADGDRVVSGSSTQQTELFLGSFFSSVLPSSLSFRDADVLYDPERERFVVAAVGDWAPANASYLFIGVSTDRAGDSPWHLYRFDTGPVSLGNVSLNADTWGVYVAADATTELETFARLWVFDAGLFSGNVSAPTVFFPTWPTDGSLSVLGLKAAAPHTVSSEAATFFVATQPAGGDEMLILKIQGDRSSVPTATQQAVTVPECFPIGNRVEQPGTELDLPGGDCSVADAIYSFRRIYAVWTHDESQTSSRSGIQTVRINTDNGNLVSQHFLDNGPGLRWYYFNPALTILGGDDPNLDIGLFFNYTQRDNRFVSAGAQIYGTDGEETFVVLHQGTEPWTQQESDDPFLARWGRSSGAAYDWHQPGVMWGAVQVVEQGQWENRVFKIAMDDRPHPTGGSVCVEQGFNACLLGERFEVTIRYTDFAGQSGSAGTSDVGRDTSRNFWFFDPDNWEMLAKVLDGCGVNGHYWVFGAATTNVGYTMTVTDTATGRFVTYTNPLGTASAAITDTEAFDCL